MISARDAGEKTASALRSLWMEFGCEWSETFHEAVVDAIAMAFRRNACIWRRRSVRDRLLEFLVKNNGRNFTQECIAEVIDSSRETVTRTLIELETEGIVTRERIRKPGEHMKHASGQFRYFVDMSQLDAKPPAS